MRSPGPGLRWGVLFLLGAWCSAAGAQNLTLPLQRVQQRLPPGFKIALYYAGKIPGARSMALVRTGASDVVYVGSRGAGQTDDIAAAVGKVYAVLDRNGDGIAEEMRPVLENMYQPNGIAVKEGALFVAEINRITRYDDVNAHILSNWSMPAPVLINDQFPSNGWHGWKYIAFGPDGKLYVPLGAPCNECKCEKAFGNISYCSLNRMDADGTNVEPYASGIRNTVGFDWEPESGTLWLALNGRDNLGDNAPDDTLVWAPEPGLDFGFPFCHWLGEGDPLHRALGAGHWLSDPQFLLPGASGATANAAMCNGTFQAPSQALGPHVAALAVRFYRGAMFPPQYNGTAFITNHGSWNRAADIGYRLIEAKVDGFNGETLAWSIFADGWMQDNAPWGRPVDILEMPDGALLVSDDFAGAIYRITYDPAVATVSA